LILFARTAVKRRHSISQRYLPHTGDVHYKRLVVPLSYNAKQPFMNLPKLLILVVALMILCRLNAQDINEHHFARYTKEQGLSHDCITGIAQDSTGYIWLSTRSGLNRYNGSHFIQFHSNNDSLSLPAEDLAGLIKLDRHRLASFSNGIHIINTLTGARRNIFIPWQDKQYQYKFNMVMCIKGNAAGDLFVVTRSGFYHYNKDYQLVYRFDYYSRPKIATEHFVFGRDMLWLDDHRLLVTSIDGLYCYDIVKRQLKKMETADCPILSAYLNYPRTNCIFLQQKPGEFFIIHVKSDSLVYIDIARQKKTFTRFSVYPAYKEFQYSTKLIRVSDTLLYLTGHRSGFYKLHFSPASGAIQLYPEKYFPAYRCNTLFTDKDNMLWIATNKGLFRQDDTRLHIQQAALPAMLEAMSPNISIGHITTWGNRLYVGTSGFGGLLIFDKNSLRFIKRTVFENYLHTDTSNTINALEPGDHNTLWVGTMGPLFRLNLQTGKSTPVMMERWDMKTGWIADLYKDKKGVLWIASHMIHRYDSSTGKGIRLTTTQQIFHKIHSTKRIREDRSGNIWMAGHGLLRYNTTSDSIDLLIDSFPFIKMPDKQVNTFITDDQNNLWINSNNNGLICYNIDKRTFRHFTRDNGLPDNNIASMIIVGNKLWIASFSGIACLDLQTAAITSFGKEDGFPDLPIQLGAKFFYDTAGNNLFLGISNVLIRFDPDGILEKKPAPRLFIESLTAGDQTYSFLPGNEVTASWQNNEITVTIGSINFLDGKSQRFAYRLVAPDKHTLWQQLGAQNTFSISNLSPGRHRIQVKLSSLNNRWPEQVQEMDIVILPPFWKQPWFITVLVAVLLLSGFLLIKWRFDVTRKKEREKTHIQQLKAEGYKNQFELEQISNYFSSSLADKKNVEEILWDVTHNLIGRMNYVDCMIYMWNEDKSKMVQKAAYGPKGNPEAISTQVFDVMPGQGVVGYVMQTREPLLIPDTRKDPRYRMDEMLRLSEICVPVIHNDELIGIIDSEHHELNYYKERDLKILTTIATLVANKIKQIESEQSLEVKQEEIATINEQLAEARLSALQTQMNPHFIFNSLNSIKRMILDNQQHKASRYLSKFAHMIRLTLNQSKEIFATLHENTEYLESYLEMERLRFDNSFSFRVIVDAGLDPEETLIPTLMIQPLVENAIWHGLMHKKGEKNVSICFSGEAGRITCTIEDNGIGINKSTQLKQQNISPYQSVGLDNLRNRIKIMNEKYRTHCTLTITDLQDIDKTKKGTLAILSFNIINHVNLVYENDPCR
jgi:putative methionine-R-sulfoxide reductase with GAF domain/two-component sensor histidine kinase